VHHDTSVHNKCFMSFSDILEHTTTIVRHNNENNIYSDCKTSEKLEASVQHSSAFTPTKLSGCKSVNESVTSLVLEGPLISNTLNQPHLLQYTSGHLQCTDTFGTNCIKYTWRFQFLLFFQTWQESALRWTAQTGESPPICPNIFRFCGLQNFNTSK